MGSLSSRPEVPSQPQVIYYMPAPTYIPQPTQPTTPPGPTPEETAAEARKASLLQRSRGRFGTVLTGFRGLLELANNASIAVTGIWQADDDGVLNPANIELVPGSIIPKAVDSKGLQPLEMPGRFDVSELMLDSLQSRIRHALLADRLTPVSGPRMTATEVLERSAEMSLLLGATYGRLQSELLTPLITRAFSILKRRGEIPDIALDGRLVVVDYRSPLARNQGQRNVQNTLSWINSVIAMGPEAASAVNLPQAARFLGEALGVPSDLIRKELPAIQGAINA